MPVAEPQSIATLLTTFALLLAVSALFGRGFERMGVPVVLAFLAIGVVTGYYALPNPTLEDHHFAFRVGVVALTLIIFDGGLNTPRWALRRALWPALSLATLGVILTAAVVAAAARLFGLPWGEAMLIGAVVSSTDAAAVFSVLRGSRIQLKHRVATTLEVESGINDPVAMILTIAITMALLPGGGHDVPVLLGMSVFQLAAGALVGAIIGKGGAFLLTKYRPPSGGLVAVVTFALALLAFGAATVVQASGFVAVYVTAVLLGNAALPMKASVVRFHDAMAWLSQITMFLLLGLLARPDRVVQSVPIALVIALALTFVARPASVLVSLLPFGFKPRETLFIGWVGLRGAVPIVLSIYPLLAGVTGAERVFDVVLILVIFNALIPGSTVRLATRRFRLEEDTPPPPGAVLQIEAAQPLDAELLSFYVSPALAVAGVQLADLDFPDGAAVSMIVRGDSLIPPKGNSVLEVGDHVYVITRPHDLGEIQLMFGRPETE
ncbi:MAG: potassium/proton antiporter [Gemmatimonadota bacterium]